MAAFFGLRATAGLFCPPMAAATRPALTYRYERWRAISSGIIETAGTTFLLLIAVRWFQAGAIEKALVAGGGSLGLVLSPLIVSWTETSGRPTAWAASRLAVIGAVSFMVAALVPLLPVFIIGCILAMTMAAASIP